MNEFSNVNFVLFIRYEKAVIAMAKQSVTLEVLSYHASASLEDAQRLRVSSIFKLLKILKKGQNFQFIRLIIFLIKHLIESNFRV